MAANSTVPGRSMPTGCVRAGVGHDPGRHDQHDQADRHVDQEDRPPGGAGDVGADQQAAHQLPDHGGDAGGGAVQGQGARLAFALRGCGGRSPAPAGRAARRSRPARCGRRSAHPTVGARPQASRGQRRSRRARPRKMRRRPKRSPSRPPRTSRAAYATPYPAITSSSADAEACSEASMLGSATLVMKKSMIGRNAPASRKNTPTGCSPPERAMARGEVGPACRAGRVVGHDASRDSYDRITMNS